MLAQTFDYPKSEHQLRTIQDEMYISSRNAKAARTRPRFKGLMEIITSDTTIITAIHNIKANKGSKTAGIDKETITKYLQQSYLACLLKQLQIRMASSGSIISSGSLESQRFYHCALLFLD